MDSRNAITTALLIVTSVAMTSVSASVQSAALAGHNRYRQSEARSQNVANMNALVWSADLANQAAQWASKCRWGHENMGDRGENLYYASPRTASDDVYIDKALGEWMAEKKFNSDGSFSCCRYSKSCCHYTQVVSSKSTSVGCAVASCDKMYNSGGWSTIGSNAVYVVCFYAPMGNMIINGDARPYTFGQPCSNCPAGSSCPAGDVLCTAGGAAVQTSLPADTSYTGGNTINWDNPTTWDNSMTGSNSLTADNSVSGSNSLSGDSSSTGTSSNNLFGGLFSALG